MVWNVRTKAQAVLGTAVLVAASAIGVVHAPDVAANPGVVYVVNSTSDRADLVIDGACATSVAGECTLRAALGEARLSSVPVTINFNIPGNGTQTIRPATTLPRIDNLSAPVTIDGTTQPGSTINTDPYAMNATFGIELRGLGGASINGLIIVSSGNTIRGLNINSFRKQVYLNAATAADNVIVGTSIGLTPTGGFSPLFALNPGSSCIELISGAHDNRIGLPGDANRNVISGCDQKGIALYNIGTTGNTIQNNIIGLDPTGTLRRGTKSHGVDINQGAAANLIGGNGFQERNVISGNYQSGIEISHGTATNYNAAIGNLVGTDLTGTTFSSATVNGQIGVRLEGSASCSGVCALDLGYATVTDNVIVNSTLAGVYVDKGVHDSVIARNLIGVLPNGTAAPNVGYGVRIEAGATRIQFTDNVVAYNGKGVQIAATGAMPTNTTSSPTHSISMLRNLIYANVGSIPIDLAPWGSPNDASRGNKYVNNDMRIPVLSNVTATSVKVSTCGGCAVEVYVATTANGYGGATALLATATADASGKVTVDFTSDPSARQITALATNGAGSTSEYARNVVAPGG